MELFDGVPVWHASAATYPPRPLRALDLGTRTALVFATGAALGGVGRDPNMRETGRMAVHVRRHVTDAEWAIVGGPRDIRGTPEERERLDALRVALGRPA